MSTGRFGGAGFDADLMAMLAVDVDLAGLDRGLNEARGRTASALGAMERSATAFSRNSRFAFQNAAFQVQDFVVQVGSGTSALRAFALQAPQFASAFGPVGTAIGTVVALAAVLGSAFLATGRDAGEAADDIDTLDEALSRLVTSSDDVSRKAEQLTERFAQATDQVREFIRAQADADVANLGDQLDQARREFEDAVGRFEIGAGQGTLFGDLDPEAVPGLQQLVDDFANLRIGAKEFRDELQPFIAQAGPNSAAVLEDLGDAARLSGARVLELSDQLRSAEEQAGRLDRLAEQGARLGREEFGPVEAPPPTRAERPSREPVDREAAEAERRLEALRDKLRDLRAEVEAARAGPFDELSAQIRDLAEVSRTLDLTPEELAAAPPEVRDLAQSYVELSQQVRDLTAANKEAAEAQAAQQAAQERILAQRRADADREARRVDAGGRLPDTIDAASLAAGELSTTLTDLDNLDFDNLATSFAGAAQSILTQLAQMIIQALLFRAIMGALGFAGGGAAGFAGTAAGGGSTAAPLIGGIPTFSRGGAFKGGRLATAQHGAIFRRGEMALMTGALSGAALLEGAQDEAAVPLTRTRSGALGVAVEGGGGGPATVYNIDARQAAPGTASTIANMIQRIAPGATVNARARGRLRDRAPF